MGSGRCSSFFFGKITAGALYSILECVDAVTKAAVLRKARLASPHLELYLDSEQKQHSALT